MLTNDQLETITFWGYIRPAVDPARPQPGEIVRVSRIPHGSVTKSDHREIIIVETGTDGHGHEFVRGIYASPEGVVRTTSYADSAGRYPLFKRAAPAGPYVDETEQDRWRAGYTDAIAFVGRHERFLEPCAIFLEGYAAGVQARAVLQIQRPSVREMTETEEVGRGIGPVWKRSTGHALRVAA